MDTYDERVQRGVELLDEALPDWRSRIDVGRLNLESGCDCILGQTFGDFTDGVLTIFRLQDESRDWGTPLPLATATSCGFIVESQPYGWDQGSRSAAGAARDDEEKKLRAAWLKVIEAPA